VRGLSKNGRNQKIEALVIISEIESRVVFLLVFNRKWSSDISSSVQPLYESSTDEGETKEKRRKKKKKSDKKSSLRSFAGNCIILRLMHIPPIYKSPYFYVGICPLSCVHEAFSGRFEIGVGERGDELKHVVARAVMSWLYANESRPCVVIT